MTLSAVNNLNRHHCTHWPALLALLLLVPSLPAAELGMAAPPLKIGQWVRGKAVELKPAGDSKVYVLAFWETGCGPCRESLVLFNELQRRFGPRGMVLVAISPEPGPGLDQFLTASTNRIEFAIASDESRKTASAYLKAFGETGVPHAFVIDQKGRIVWHRNPMAGLDKALDEILSGKFDLEAEKRAVASVKLQHDYLWLARTNSNDSQLKKLGDQILADAVTNPWMLNNFAWAVVADKDIAKPDLDLAARCVKKAFVLTGETNSAFADTYARILFDSGQTAAAVEMEKRAIALSTDPRFRPFLIEALQKYQDKLKSSRP